MGRCQQKTFVSPRSFIAYKGVLLIVVYKTFRDIEVTPIQKQLTVTELSALLVGLSGHVVSEYRPEHSTREQNLQHPNLALYIPTSILGNTIECTYVHTLYTVQFNEHELIQTCALNADLFIVYRAFLRMIADGQDYVVCVAGSLP